MKFLRLYLPPIFIYMLIFFLSSRPASDFPSRIPDYIPHFLEYFLLAYFFIRAFGGKADTRTISLAFACLAVLALMDEFHQYFVPSRFFTLEDLLFDTLGIAAGLAAFRVKKVLLKR